MVQWLRLCTSTAGGTGSIPGWGTKILHATWCGQKKIKLKKKETLSGQSDLLLRLTYPTL